MSGPHIHTRYRTVPATLLLETLGNSLGRIKEEDSATYGDLGAALGKSADRAEAYRKAMGDMGVVSFLRGCREWDGRFANDVLALVGMKLVEADAGAGCDRSAMSALTALTAALAVALEDGVVDDGELDRMSALVERAGQQIDRLRARNRAPRLVSRS